MSRQWRLICAIWVLTFWAPAVSAQSLTATADGSRLWVLMPEADRPGVFTVYHHALTDPPALLSRVQTLRGEVRPHCVATRDHSLWIIYPDGAVQAIRAEPSILEDGWVYRARVEPRLPAGAAVRAMVLTQTGPWVLVRVEDRQALAAIDALSQPTSKRDRADSERRRRNIAIGLPPGQGIKEPDEVEGQAAQPTPPGNVDPDLIQVPPTEAPQPLDTRPATAQPSPVSLPVDRLIHLDQGRWQPVPIPDDWPHGQGAWLVAQRDQSDRPTLVVRLSHRGASQPGSFGVYRQNTQVPDAWSFQTYPAQTQDADGNAMLVVEDQLVLAEFPHESRQLSATLSVLRDGKALHVGRMSLDGVSPTQWSILGAGNAAVLIAQSSKKIDAERNSGEFTPLLWTQLDVRGKTVLEPTELVLKTRSAMDDLAQYIMLAFVVILVTVLMLAFWRRDSAWNRLDLPADVVVADLVRRAAAAAIDMAPGLLGTLAYFGLSIEELMLRWPGNGVAHSAEQMLPGAVVIVVFVTHTTITELFFARSLGKALTGLRTATLTGTRPRAWQLLTRGLLKTLDLLPWAWLLLMLPVIAPHRQRLGDLVGRTVVITDAPPQEPVENSDDESA